MGIKDVILLSLSAALVIVGAHITFTQGIMFSYPVFMGAVALLFWFKFRKANQEQNEVTGFHKEKKKKKKR